MCSGVYILYSRCTAFGTTKMLKKYILEPSKSPENALESTHGRGKPLSCVGDAGYNTKDSHTATMTEN